ncbi:hypothetical protein REJC140_02391 [Pseudorhizobium endolithicum]|uniref:Uncharacterized protein n=1 Tax=Pseudorhizobium endolithicum TaxID=1191678 RepID=A0ABM8PFH0_9HYPH|nr:hypothetical protein [Pseudorhizobium endolithicum]CAD7026518.1 hypothetical protein REJC140_02391 [Pseudorhizobium endolithicum]
MTSIILDSTTHTRLLDGLMAAAADALAVNDPAPFVIALAQIANIYPQQVMDYWTPDAEVE